MPSGFTPVATNTNTSDVDSCVSIGKDTAGRHLKTSGGVAIGQAVYGTSHTSDLDLDASVLIGKNVFPIAAVDGLAEDTIAIGKDICTTTYNQTVNDSVLIGSECCTTLTEGKNTVIGAHALKNASNVANYVTAVGFGAGQDCTGVGTGAVIIGRNACRNNSSGAFTIGSNAIIIGTGPVDGHTAPTADSITIGRDVCVDSASTTGQIKIGTQSVHNTFVVDVDQSTKLVTDSLVNVEGTATSTTLRATDASASHSVSLKCGNNKTVALNNVGLTVNCPLLTSNGILCDSDGKTLVGAGDSVWLSGSCLPGAAAVETRVSRILPPDVSVDSSHAAVLLNPQAVASVVSPLVATNAQDGNLVFASRLGIASNEFFIYVRESQVPIGWKIVGFRVNIAKRTFSSSNAVLPVAVQTALFSRTTSMTVPINSMTDTGKATDFATEHFNSGVGVSGSNMYIDVANSGTVYNSTYDSYAVIWIGLSLNTMAFCSGEIHIQRQ